MYQGQAEIRDAYRDAGVASQYIDKRFRAPLGALLHDRQSTFLRQLIRRERPQRILEIAPGPARLTADVVPVVTGSLTLVDASAQMLAEARHRLPSGRASCVHGDAFRLPFSAAFDLVYTFRLVRHFEAADRLSMLKQISTVTRPGSLLVFDAVNAVVSRRVREADPDSHQHYDALMDPESIRAEAEAGGFRVESLIGVQHRFPTLRSLQILVAPRSRALARMAMEVVDRLGGEPLEWIVLCRRV
jgi:ubiquinone/menaquinone biosynthesis C-methylase UbiE